MSADLWAEFGSGQQAESIRPAAQSSGIGPRSVPHSQAEGVSRSQALIRTASQAARRASRPAVGDPWAAFDGGGRVEASQPGRAEDADDWSAFQSAEEAVAPPQQTVKDGEDEDDADVLWDAERALRELSRQEDPFDSAYALGVFQDEGQRNAVDVNDDDDFGDFEEAEPGEDASRTPDIQSFTATSVKADQYSMRNVTDIKPVQRAQASAGGANSVPGLLDLGIAEKPAQPPKPSIPTTQRQRLAFGATARKAPPVRSDPQTDDDWGAWDDETTATTTVRAAETGTKKAPHLKPQSSTADPNGDAANQPSSKPSTAALPPSNVPPPSIILSRLAISLPDIPGAISFDWEPTTLTTPLRTAGRVLAGRKCRWKRDTHLAQSMRIGPSTAGLRSTGMKLAGLDKAEALREDREAAELVRVFKSTIGSLRGAAVKARIPGNHVPDLGGSLGVKVLGAEKGGIKAEKPCVLCGLRRDERVGGGVDADVFDGFGEWWVDFWGHKECKEWWEGLLNGDVNNINPR